RYDRAPAARSRGPAVPVRVRASAGESGAARRGHPVHQCRRHPQALVSEGPDRGALQGIRQRQPVAGVRHESADDRARAVLPRRSPHPGAGMTTRPGNPSLAARDPVGMTPMRDHTPPETESDDPFVEHRRLLFATAYRMLGTVTDAEDVLQDAWITWHG